MNRHVRASAMLAPFIRAAAITAAIIGSTLLPSSNVSAQESVTYRVSLDEPNEHVWGVCEETLPETSSLADIDTCKDGVLKQLNKTERQAYHLPLYTSFTITLTAQQAAAKGAELARQPLFQHQDTKPLTEEPTERPSAPEPAPARINPIAQSFGEQQEEPEARAWWIDVLWIALFVVALVLLAWMVRHYNTRKQPAVRKETREVEVGVAEGRTPDAQAEPLFPARNTPPAP